MFWKPDKYNSVLPIYDRPGLDVQESKADFSFAALEIVEPLRMKSDAQRYDWAQFEKLTIWAAFRSDGGILGNQEIFELP